MRLDCNPGAVFAAIPVSEMVWSPTPLFDTYPAIGADEGSVYYADPSSYYAALDGNKTIISGLMYGTGGDALPDGSPGKLTPYAVTYETYKNKKGKRVIEVKSIKNTKNGADAASRFKESENFLRAFFWTIVDHSWLAGSIDK